MTYLVKQDVKKCASHTRRDLFFSNHPTSFIDNYCHILFKATHAQVRSAHVHFHVRIQGDRLFGRANATHRRHLGFKKHRKIGRPRDRVGIKLNPTWRATLQTLHRKRLHCSVIVILKPQLFFSISEMVSAIIPK